MERLARYEARAAIQDLKSRYARAADLVFGFPSAEHTRELLALFTEDASLDLGPFGKFKGHAELICAFTDVLPSVTRFSAHYITNHSVDVDGESATGTASFLVFMKPAKPEGAPLTHAFGVYEEKYRCVAGTWKFSEVVARFSAPPT